MPGERGVRTGGVTDLDTIFRYTDVGIAKLGPKQMTVFRLGLYFLQKVLQHDYLRFCSPNEAAGRSLGPSSLFSPDQQRVEFRSVERWW